MRASCILISLLLLATGCSSPHEEAAKLDRELREAAKTNPALVIDPGVGVGPVRFGMTSAELEAAIGEPYRVTGGAWEYQHLGLAVMFDREDRIHVILAGAWCEPSDILLDVFKGETPEGLKLRSTRAETIAAYGEPLSVRSIDTGFEVLSYPEVDLAFRDGQMVHMTWRSFPIG